MCVDILWFPLLLILPLYIIAGGCTKTEKKEGQGIEEDAQSFHGVGVCKWFNVRMGFGFLSMNRREGVLLEVPVDVFVHQVTFFSFLLFIILNFFPVLQQHYSCYHCL